MLASIEALLEWDEEIQMPAVLGMGPVDVEGPRVRPSSDERGSFAAAPFHP